tara:strand:+ start:330 stop:2129 length:1800 start_codon:yes stop_codon:yes gene_type:complete
MPKNKNVIIKYTSRDFQSIKQDLVDYAQRYYSEGYRDFTEASFGSMMIDTVAYIGDTLSYYLDYNVNESFLDTSLEYENVRKHAAALGYNFSGTPSSYGIVSIFVIVPANSDGTAPDTSYLPILKTGATFSGGDGGNFILTQDVNFADASADIVSARFDSTTGATTFFAVRAYGQVQSGTVYLATIDLAGTVFEKFRKVRVADSNVSEIISVIDSDGRRYYQVDNLAQEVVFVETTNKTAASDGVRSILKPFSATRRFTLVQDDTGTYLQFGFGSEDSTANGTVDPSAVALKMHGKNYITSKSFDPTRLMSTDRLGVSPYNTILKIVYRANSPATTNIGANKISSVLNKTFVFTDPTILVTASRQSVENSIEVNNDKPITSATNDLSVEEIKVRAKAHYATQNRAVTKEDYESLVYNMPTQFGAIKRANILNDPSSTNRRLSLYLISEDNNGYLAMANDITKNNVKNWLNRFKSLNDVIEIIDPRVINFGVEFSVVIDQRFSSDSVVFECTQALQDYFSEVFYIGEPIYLTKIYDKLNRVDGVDDTRRVIISNKTGGAYSGLSLSFDKILSKDGTFIKTPKNAIMELKFPNLDIKGTAK